MKLEIVTEGFPDCDCVLSVKSMALDELRDFIRAIPDGHVMLQTVQPKELYTGNRDYDLR